MEVKVHENKICRALCRGPMLYGLPLMQTFGVLLGGGPERASDFETRLLKESV